MEKLEISQIDDSFAHEMAKLLRAMGYNDVELRQIFNQSLLMSQPSSALDFLIIIMHRMGIGKTPKPLEAGVFRDFETVRQMWFNATPKAAQILLEKTFYLLFTTYLK